jgi:acetolactate synthase-1/2/3 large subunit
VQSSIDLALSHPGPVLIDFQVEEYENTFPMVPPGASLQETVDSPYERHAGVRDRTPAAGGTR